MDMPYFRKKMNSYKVSYQSLIIKIQWRRRMNNRHRAINKITKRNVVLRNKRLGYKCDCRTAYQNQKSKKYFEDNNIVLEMCINCYDRWEQ